MIAQTREIGETEWANSSLDWFNHCQYSPEHDTRVVSQKWLDNEAKKEAEKITKRLTNGT